MLVTTVVLINLLIAMMSDTYQRIQASISSSYWRLCSHAKACNFLFQQQSDVEWKFGLAKLIRYEKLPQIRVLNLELVKCQKRLGLTETSGRCIGPIWPPHPSTLWQLGWFTYSGCAREVFLWNGSQRRKVWQTVSGKKGKVGDYSKVNDGKGSKNGKSECVKFKPEIKYHFLKVILWCLQAPQQVWRAQLWGDIIFFWIFLSFFVAFLTIFFFFICSVRDGTKIENVLDWNAVVKKYYAVVKSNSGEN